MHLKNHFRQYGVSVAVLMLCLALGMLLAADSFHSSPGIQIVVDPRVELMSIVFRLAGNLEYRQGRVASYAKDVDEYFAKFRDHPAVEMARRLRDNAGIVLDAPMSLAVHVTNVFSLEERVRLAPRPPELDFRWTPDSARGFLAVLRSFVKDADFKGFLEHHQNFYRTAVERLSAVLDGPKVRAWFDGFFGARPNSDFIVALGLLNGGSSYGPSIRLPAGRGEIYSILGVSTVDNAGLPKFEPSVVATIIHEFGHAYANPLIEAHKAELETAAKKIFHQVADDMRKQAYGSWEPIMYESLVRACCVRYTLAFNGPEAAAQEVNYNRNRRFLWTGELANLLGEYEKQRDRYPTLDSFFSKITAFFTKYSRNIETEVATFKEEKRRQMEDLKAKSPKIVSLVPANEASGVDPRLKSIVVTFDRPMKLGYIAVIRLDANRFPKVKDQVSFDAKQMVLTIPVELEPNREYVLGLNAEETLVMQDEQGNPLAPVVIRFKTRK